MKDHNIKIWKCLDFTIKPGLLNRKDFLIKGPKGGNILHLTAKLDKFENFKALVDCLNLSHEDIMATDGKGRTVFHLAVKKESYDFIISVFKYLFESDKLMAEDFTVKDINGRAISDRQPDLLFNNLIQNYMAKCRRKEREKNCSAGKVSYRRFS